MEPDAMFVSTVTGLAALGGAVVGGAATIVAQVLAAKHAATREREMSLSHHRYSAYLKALDYAMSLAQHVDKNGQQLIEFASQDSARDEREYEVGWRGEILDSDSARAKSAFVELGMVAPESVRHAMRQLIDSLQRYRSTAEGLVESPSHGATRLEQARADFAADYDALLEEIRKDGPFGPIL
ncbi:hypothetical protein [Agrococcus sp. ARC_14]|uniref:hypothetical protein n=1 Tax=Agrococcus sp. ARC_14 TaxID=2919927 RepID=UPI001F06FB89|nr:hypothetical protein [Agrococcus sp. ARC_14]MCH1881550.1 hypothetical protein [Agrococcus sp. ARC_14]